MHIRVNNISLTSLEFEVHPENSENLNYNLAVSCASEFPDSEHLIQMMEFDLCHKVQDPPFTLKCTFISVFQSEGEGTPSLEEFSKHNAPAYVVPYVRELIFNITSRLGIIPPLIIPPINVFQLMNENIDPKEAES